VINRRDPGVQQETPSASRAVHKYRAIGLAQTFRSAIPHDWPKTHT